MFDNSTLSTVGGTVAISTSPAGAVGGSVRFTKAAVNAGGGNVKKWIDAYGDPRKSGVDPIDWVERIPFTETRNYVQRVMENLQVYRNRLDGRSALLIEGDLRRGAR